MTRLSLVLAASLPLAAIGSDDPKMPQPKLPPTELEGTWQEPLPPGVKDGLRLTITFTGETATIDLYGRVLHGSFTHHPGRSISTVQFVMKTADGTTVVVGGIYQIRGGSLGLQIGPEAVVAAADGLRVAPLNNPGQLRRAPLSLTLVKVAK